MRKCLGYSVKLLILLFLIGLTACKRKEVPTVTTVKVSEITSYSAVSGGNVTDDGGAVVLQKGVCWSIIPNPTKSLATKTIDGSGLGAFTSFITGLKVGSTYNVRAYATNSEGTAYGENRTFSTLIVYAPEVKTKAVSAVSSRAAVAEGEVISTGGDYVETGVCLSISPNPDAGSLLVAGSSLQNDNFVCIIPELEGNTTYYFKAYAANQVGIAYGDQITFTTLELIEDIDGNKYGIVNIGPMVWMTENLETTRLNDGTSIQYVSDQSTWNTLTTSGYCWYNNDASYKLTNGALYNWHAVNSGKLCPVGWHVPSDSEWQTLISYLGGENMAATRMSRYRYELDNSLFWALSAGVRDTIIGFLEPGGCGGLDYSRWWSSTSSGTFNAWSEYMTTEERIFKSEFSKKYGFSVRCIKD